MWVGLNTSCIVFMLHKLIFISNICGNCNINFGINLIFAWFFFMYIQIWRICTTTVQNFNHFYLFTLKQYKNTHSPCDDENNQIKNILVDVSEIPRMHKWIDLLEEFMDGMSATYVPLLYAENTNDHVLPLVASLLAAMTLIPSRTEFVGWTYFHKSLLPLPIVVSKVACQYK